jgi:hypothetical protein
MTLPASINFARAPRDARHIISEGICRLQTRLNITDERGSIMSAALNYVRIDGLVSGAEQARGAPRRRVG